MAPSRFVWYELMTTDAAAAKAFYGEVMGWSARDASMPGMAYALFSAELSFVAGVLDLPPEAIRTGAMPRWLGYVEVEDVDAAALRVQELGGGVQVAPKDIPTISRFSIVTDPQGAALALFKGAMPSQQQSASFGAPGRVGWHELLAADWEKAFAFYSALFGWRKADATSGPVGAYQQFSDGEQTVGGMFTKPAAAPAPFWLYYFGVGDLDAAAERVKAGGGRVLDGPLAVPGGSFIARCADPQGAAFALEGPRRSGAASSPDPSAARGRWVWWIDQR